MDCALKLSLLSALMLLVSAHASNYESLTDDLRYYVDKSLENTRNDYPSHHVAYMSMKPQITENTVNVQVYLKVFKCKKDPRNADKCVPQNNVLHIIDCLVCKTTENEELIDCGKLKEVQMKKREQRSKCKDRKSTPDLPGGKTLLLRAEDSQIRCLGCM